MRISDWSSDVCSSDLGRCGNPSRPRRMTRPQSCAGSEPPVTLFIGVESSLPNQTPVTSSAVKPMNQASRKSWLVPVLPAAARPGCAALPVPQTTAAAIMLPICARSEEHTSELQSLMRISYAVFCLKQNITTNETATPLTQHTHNSYEET